MLTFVFVCIIGIISIQGKKKLNEWKENRKCPRLTHDAAIITKRTNIVQYQIKGKKIWHDVVTYHMTFQIPNDEQVELCIPYKVYRILFDGDKGNLTFQGTKFFAFERAV